MYEVLDKDTIKFENLPHSSVTKRGYVTKKIAAEGHSVHSLQVESGQSVAHNEEKVKEYFFMFLMFLCQHGHICAKTRKVNVFVKPNEQCRARSNIVMARIGNRRHGALSEVERQNTLLEGREKNN